MKKQRILRCCSMEPGFFVEYVVGSKYYVCRSHEKLSPWNSGIKHKRDVNNDAV